MKKSRKLMSALLAMSLAFSLLSVNASALVPSTDFGGSTQSVTVSTPVSLDIPASHTYILFLVNKEHPYWKIQFQTSNPKLRFHITKDSPTGEIVYEPDLSETGGYIPVNNTPYYGQLDEGTYYVTVYVSGGATNLQGKLWYKFASTEAEAQ